MPSPLNVVVDISHHNGNVNLAKAKEDGILGVIQKATQGQSFKDPTYQRNRRKANDAGLLWGAYHFGTGSDGLKQAQHFLDVVGNDTWMSTEPKADAASPVQVCWLTWF
jgi:lysozyme